MPTWTEEKIRTFLRQETLPYRQKISLPYGLSVRGKERMITADLVFQGDITGKAILVIGSCLGYFCLEAVERGAGRVVGCDVDPEQIRQARIIADIKGIDVEYVQADIDRTIPDDDFDIILCMNVLQHLFHPVAVIEQLIQRAQDTLILEVASLGSADRRKTLELTWLHEFFLAGMSTIIVGRGNTAFQDNKNKQSKYFFTRKALQRILQYHRNDCIRIDFHDAEFTDRFIVVAHKRKIRHLVVVAGLRASGKTTFIKRLVADTYPQLTEKLGVKNFEDWDIVEAADLPHYHKMVSDDLLFHYNLLRPYKRSTRIHQRDEALHILNTARQISFLTLYTEPERLRTQLIPGRATHRMHSKYVYRTLFFRLKTSSKQVLQKILQLPGIRLSQKLPGVSELYKKVFQDRAKRHMKVLKVYQRDEQILRHYREWLDYIARLELDVRHNIIVSIRDDQLALYSRHEWESMIEGASK